MWPFRDKDPAERMPTVDEMVADEKWQKAMQKVEHAERAIEHLKEQLVWAKAECNQAFDGIVKRALEKQRAAASDPDHPPQHPRGEDE